MNPRPPSPKGTFAERRRRDGLTVGESFAERRHRGELTFAERRRYDELTVGENFAERHRRGEPTTFAERRRYDELTVGESFLLTSASAALTLVVGAAVGAVLWWAALQLGIDWEASRYFRINIGMAVGFACLFAGMSGAYEYVGFGIGILILTISPYFIAPYFAG